MSDWARRVVVLGVFLGVLLLPLLWGGGGEDGEDSAGAGRRLIIVSPHNAQIRYEIERAFDAWHREQYGEGVDIAWRSLGGTGDIQRVLASKYRRLAERGAEEMFAGYDMVFGGGDYFFDRVLKPGITIQRGEADERRLSLTEAVEIDAALLEAAYPTARIAGNKLYDPAGHWYGVVLSSFGIVYNADWLAIMGAARPGTWSDIAGYGYYGKVALADPSHSGSVRVTYNAVLQRYGWERGLGTLRRMFANARYFAPGSSKVPTDVSQGGAAAGVAIDFYGRYQSQVVGGGERVGYVAPKGATVVTADPIGVLRGAKHKETAKRLIAFLLTVEGQAVWSFAVGDPMGPEKFELRRAPIRRDMYERYGDRLVDAVNPYEVAEPVPEGTPNYFGVVPPLLHAMCMDVHGDLQGAWRSVNAVEAEAAGLRERIESGAVGDVSLARRELERLYGVHQRMVEAFDATPMVDALALARRLPASGPADAEAAGRWVFRHGEPLDRVGWAMGQLEGGGALAGARSAWAGLRERVEAVREAAGAGDERALGAAVEGLGGTYGELRAALVSGLEAVAAEKRTIGFHATIRTIGGAVWARHERARLKDRLAWTKFFRARYGEVVEMAREAGVE